jgi:hypothetical protein
MYALTNISILIPSLRSFGNSLVKKQSLLRLQFALSGQVNGLRLIHIELALPGAGHSGGRKLLVRFSGGAIAPRGDPPPRKPSASSICTFTNRRVLLLF